MLIVCFRVERMSAEGRKPTIGGRALSGQELPLRDETKIHTKRSRDCAPALGRGGPIGSPFRSKRGTVLRYLADLLSNCAPLKPLYHLEPAHVEHCQPAG